MKTTIACALCVLGATVSGCGPYLARVTVPPPNRTAEVTSDPLAITITEGVAMAVECMDNGPCVDMQATSDNARVAQVSPAYLVDQQRRWWSPDNPISNLVVYGVAAGSTAIRVRSGKRVAVYAVTVVPAPTLTPASTPDRR